MKLGEGCGGSLHSLISRSHNLPPPFHPWPALPAPQSDSVYLDQLLFPGQLKQLNSWVSNVMNLALSPAPASAGEGASASAGGNAGSSDPIEFAAAPRLLELEDVQLEKEAWQQLRESTRSRPSSKTSSASTTTR